MNSEIYTRIDCDAIADKVIKAIEREPVAHCCSYPFVSVHNVKPAVESLAQEIARREAAAALFRSHELRDVFKKFDGKVINKRFWNAIDDACYNVMPAAAPWICAGVEVKPAAVRLIDGTSYGCRYFARVLWSNQVRAFGGAVHDSLMLGRVSDWTKGEDVNKTEYKIITGERLDAARALAALDYEAEQYDTAAERVRMSLDLAGDLIARYLRAVVGLAECLDVVPHAFREAFALGTRATLPSSIH